MNPENKNQLLHFETHVTNKENSEWVLFVHGAGGSTRTWRKQTESFAPHFNLLLIDLPGHANSSLASIDQMHYDFEWIGNKIWEVVDALRISKVHIIAVSLGSIIGMQMHHSRPSQVHSMVFAGPIVGLNFKLRLLARTGLTLAKVVGFQNFYALTARIALPRKNHKKSREIFVRESKLLTDQEYRKWTAMYGKTLDNTLLKLFYHHPAISIYFLVGAQDHLFIQPARSYAQKYERVKMEVIDKCGHLVSLEKSDIFNEKCLSFLQHSALINIL